MGSVLQGNKKQKIILVDGQRALAAIVFSQSLIYSLAQPLRKAVKVQYTVHYVIWTLQNALIPAKSCFIEMNIMF